MNRRTFIRLVGGGIVFSATAGLTACSSEMPPEALQEYPEQAQEYQKIHNLLDAPPPRYTVQMWARAGYGPKIEPAPRRGLEAHIIA